MTEPADVLVVRTFVVVGTGSFEELGFGAEGTFEVTGVVETVTGVVGVTVCMEPFGMVANPAGTLADTIVTHTEFPERAESKVTLTGRVPIIGVVWTKAWTRSVPAASILRDIRLNGICVFPTEAVRATYEASGTSNSKE